MTKSDIFDRLQRAIPPHHHGECEGESTFTLFRDAIAEIERLRAENAALWERVKRWEPLADPNSVQAGN